MTAPSSQNCFNIRVFQIQFLENMQLEWQCNTCSINNWENISILCNLQDEDQLRQNNNFFFYES